MLLHWGLGAGERVRESVVAAAAAAAVGRDFEMVLSVHWSHQIVSLLLAAQASQVSNLIEQRKMKVVVVFAGSSKHTELRYLLLLPESTLLSCRCYWG